MNFNSFEFLYFILIGVCVCGVSVYHAPCHWQYDVDNEEVDDYDHEESNGNDGDDDGKDDYE